jgi:hypothetical protein
MTMQGVQTHTATDEIFLCKSGRMTLAQQRNCSHIPPRR